MTRDERTCCVEQRWPGPDEREVVYDLLADADSPHWAACRQYVQRLVQFKAQKAYYAALSQDDVVQESMISILKSLRDFRFDSSFTTWLRKIVDRRMIDASRTSSRSAVAIVSLDVPDGSVEGEGERDVAAGHTVEEECLVREELRETLTCLLDYARCHTKPERNRQILNLVLLQGYSAKDTAARLCIPLPVVNHVVRSARQHIRCARRSPFSPSL
jgi:RNA polymerase sigma factor (sigma-70 family)